MKLGIVGMPNVGKSTLFNALTRAQAASENYPFCTIDPNVGIVPVPDERLDILQKLYNSRKLVNASVEFVDIAGLVKGASQGEGLGNKFLSHIRETDAILHLVRCFVDDKIIHVEGSTNPQRDIDTINTELILADLETLQKRLDKFEKEAKSSSDKKIKQVLEFSKKLMEHLSKGEPARTFHETEEEKEIINDLFLLTSKPIIYVANIAESDIGKDHADNQFVKEVEGIAAQEKAGVVVISAKVEQDLAQLDENDKKEFLAELGLNESGLDKLIKESYKLLGYISFLTAGEQEVRAWTIVQGTKAPQAAGKIHTDFEKGFIRAEIVNYHDLIKAGSVNACKSNGKLRVEGKDYIMQDDDVVLFRFNL
jgi:hypothetical protein